MLTFGPEKTTIHASFKIGWELQAYRQDFCNQLKFGEIADYRAGKD